MPANLVKKYAKDTGISASTAEKRWEAAKKAADDAAESQGFKKDSVKYWSYVTGTFKKMMGLSEEDSTLTDNDKLFELFLTKYSVTYPE